MLKVVEMVTHQQERMVVKMELNYMVRLIVMSVVLKMVEMVKYKQERMAVKTACWLRMQSKWRG